MRDRVSSAYNFLVPLRTRMTGLLAAAAIAPALFWLGPALAVRLVPSFRDQGDFFYPLKLYTADRLRAGEIPLWNPLSGAGEPWLANGQAGVFYPPGLLFLLPWPAVAGILFLLVHFTIGAWGMRRFLAQEGVSESGALFGSAVFVASGPAASLSAFWNHFGAYVYLPAIVSVARHSRDCKRWPEAPRFPASPRRSRSSYLSFRSPIRTGRGSIRGQSRR